MLREIKTARQDEHPRRWFTGGGLDLLVWLNEDESVAGFQLTYGPEDARKILTWLDGRGYSHENLDEGEDRAFRYKMSPIALPDGFFDSRAVAAVFHDMSAGIEPELRQLIYAKLLEFKAPL